ncbi:MAG: FAD-dependent oxidoreductase [Caldimonas sp.]
MRLVLLGGGHAHLHALRAFAAAPVPHAQITLVSPLPALIYTGMVPGLIAGRYRNGECTIPLAPLADRAGAEFILAAATAIDAGARSVKFVRPDGSTAAVGYDILSLDVGGVTNAASIPGAGLHAFLVRPLDRFVGALERRLAEFGRAPSDVVVVGGGAGGFELALALRLRLGGAARIHLVAGGPTLLAAHPTGVRRRAQRALRRRDVVVYEDRCIEIGARDIVLGAGSRVACDLAFVATGSAAPHWLRGSGLALDPDGYIATGATLQSLSHETVFAAGDVATRVDAPRPRNGVHAVRAGPPLAHNLRCALERRPLAAYRPQTRSLSLLACGDRSAIASWGSWSCEGRAVWWLKDRIDCRFVAGYRTD